MSRFVIITPPPLKPSEPGVSAGAAAEAFRRLGVDARSRDASIEWHRFALSPHRLRSALELARGCGWSPGALRAAGQALRITAGSRTPLRRAETYRRREVYTSAIRELELALRLTTVAQPRFKLGVAMISLEPSTDRLESTRVLEALSLTPGPFDDYFMEELIPSLEAEGTNTIGISLSFQQQAPAAFRLAALLEERLPSTLRILGGPLVACWQAAGFDLRRPPFDRFHQRWDGTEADMARLAQLIGAQHAPTPRESPLSVDLDEAPWEAYLTPQPIIPAVLGRGCQWRRCTFCPDHLHPRHHPCSVASLSSWLNGLAARFPEGAMLHLTDSALPPAHLAEIARVVIRDQLPLSWHGFARLEAEFQDPDFARTLARGGCATLQLGVESGSRRLLETMGKGTNPDSTRSVIKTLSEAGIRAYVYLLFGAPGETDHDRELTLQLVEDLAQHIGAINHALLNLPKGSPMHRRPERYGITELLPFHEETDLSLYDDFRCGDSHPRVEARRWMERRFFKAPAVRSIIGNLRSPFKANHLCFLESEHLDPKKRSAG